MGDEKTECLQNTSCINNANYCGVKLQIIHKHKIQKEKLFFNSHTSILHSLALLATELTTDVKKVCATWLKGHT